MTRHQWTPDRVIDAELAAAVVADQFPDLAGLPVRRFGEGWDNVLYAVGDEWLFRFIHRSVALPGARRELAVLTELADSLPLPIPHPVHIGTPTAEVPWPFWGTRVIPGSELAEAGLDDDARVGVARSMGEFLRALHGPELAESVTAAAEAAGAPLPVDPMRRADPSHTAAQARETLARLVAAGVGVGASIDADADADADAYVDDDVCADRAAAAGPGGFVDGGSSVLALPYEALENLLTTAEAVGAPTGRPVLVHGDLHVRHVLMAPAGEATGVVDWGDTALGDPAVDLMLVYAAFAGDARAAFFDAYGEVDAATALRARALAVRVCTLLLEYALAEQYTALAAESWACLCRAVA
ncbi:phosphotransferase [Georgenia sp. MJ206]|uniref:phosphotransferase n=1 Tax=Georgenia wangjunii TaxID=3117730 RepID=UPI002F26C146